MGKGVFFNVPASGHINPSLPLVAELVKRGEEITYYLSEGYRAQIEAAGAKFAAYTSVSDDYFEQFGLDGKNPPHTARRLLETSAHMLDQYVEPLREAQIDYVIYDAMCPWGNLIGQALGVPRISSMALLFLGAGDLKVGTMISLFWRALPHLVGFTRAASAIRKRWQFIEVPSLPQTLIAPADLTISYTSAEFQPHSDSYGANICYIGPSIAPRPDETDFPFELLDGRPLVYVSLGTVVNDNPAFFRACLAAFADQPVQLVLSTGDKVHPKMLGEIPPNAIVCPKVPQLELLQRAALFITHAGLNSVHEGLYYGVPLIAVPQHVEQSYTADRIVELGAGIKLDSAAPGASQIRTAAETVMATPAYKRAAERLGAGFREAGGQARGAQVIIEWVQDHARSMPSLSEFQN